MKPVLVVLTVIALLMGSTLTMMHKACKNGQHAWCTSRFANHTKIQPPA